MKVNVNDYVRTKDGLIRKIVEIDKLIYIDKDYISDEPEYHNSLIEEDVIKSSPDIIDLLKPMDLLYIDIDNGYAGGIIVPRIAETQAELNLIIDLIKSGKWILKDVVTNEQLDSMKYEVGD